MAVILITENIITAGNFCNAIKRQERDYCFHMVETAHLLLHFDHLMRHYCDFADYFLGRIH